MKRTAPARYEEAFEVLGLAASSPVRELKRAYRAQVVAHPPDRDPEGFRRVREAYELLSKPEAALGVLLELDTPVAAPSVLPPPRVEALPLATLRALVAELDVAALLGDGDAR